MIIKIRHGDTSQKDRKKITTDEKYKFDRAWKVASLVENFGKIAISVISGYGVGTDTAAIMLRNMVDEEYLFKQIYEAERQYVMTRGFWGGGDS
jgi:ATP-dependent Lhr-like helicase